MTRKFEIEITSKLADGEWTWRAAGARLPKGTVVDDLVPSGATVGSILRAETEQGIDGIEIVSLSEPKPLGSEKPIEGRIELIVPLKVGPDVSVSYARGDRKRRDKADLLDPKRSQGRSVKKSDGSRKRTRGDEAASTIREKRGLHAPGTRQRASSHSEGESRVGTDRKVSPQRGHRASRTVVSTVHRNAMFAELKPEELPIAEQLLRGGIPAVRKAIDEQNLQAKLNGAPPIASDALILMAERLLPGVKLSEWKDRAASAQASGRDLSLRELKAVVAASRTVILDDEARTQAKALRESLEARTTALQENWLGHISNQLEKGKVLEALQTVKRPPDPSVRCPADLAVKLSEAAGEAMTSELDPAQWIQLLEAVVESPVRRTVKPRGLPSNEDVFSAARHAVGQVPALAKFLGLKIPPPPPRRSPTRKLTPTAPANDA